MTFKRVVTMLSCLAAAGVIAACSENPETASGNAVKAGVALAGRDAGEAVVAYRNALSGRKPGKRG